MVLDTYGRSSGFCIDPIEKKPLNHFLPGTPVLSFGTAGCNLGCRFCQNWDISKARAQDRLMSPATPKQLAIAARKTGCRSIAFTYNDPTIFAEYAIDVAAAARDLDVRTVAVTAGYIGQSARAEFFGAMDAANIDLKAFTNEFYERTCFARLPDVLETISYAVNETSTWVELTTLLIPDANDSVEEIEKMTRWVVRELGRDVPMHFSAFHPDFKMLDKPRTPLATLLRARDIALNNGVRYVYTGNVHHPPSDTTWCHGCGEALIERDWFEINHYRMAGNACSRCHRVIPGAFEQAHGTWGRRRQTVDVARVAGPE
jgi:pyruvate formate lyase activating enzyme